MTKVDITTILARVTQLSGEARTAAKAWERSLAQSTKASSRPPVPLSATAQDVLRDLEAQLATLRREEGIFANAITAECAAAEEWERRAMLAVQEGRDDQAKSALGRQGEHAAAVETLDAERHVLAAIRDSLDKMVIELRERVAQSPPSS